MGKLWELMGLTIGNGEGLAGVAWGFVAAIAMPDWAITGHTCWIFGVVAMVGGGRMGASCSSCNARLGDNRKSKYGAFGGAARGRNLEKEIFF